MQFLTTNKLELNAAGYLVSNDQPVTHAQFVAEQKNAEYICKLADAIKGKKFKADKVDDLASIKAEIRASINATRSYTYEAVPAEPTSKIKDELTQFALDFDKFQDEKGNVEKVNSLMQQFNTIKDIETVGDYFSEGVVKLNKIYSIDEILSAVKATVDILN